MSCSARIPDFYQDHCSNTNRGGIDNSIISSCDIVVVPDTAVGVFRKHGIQPIFEDISIKMEGRPWSERVGGNTFNVAYEVQIDLTETYRFPVNLLEKILNYQYNPARYLCQNKGRIGDGYSEVEHKMVQRLLYDVRLAMLTQTGLHPYKVKYLLSYVTMGVSMYSNSGSETYITLTASEDLSYVKTPTDTTTLRSSLNVLGTPARLRWEKENQYQWNGLKYVHNYLIPPDMFESLRDKGIFPILSTLRCQKYPQEDFMQDRVYRYSVDVVKPLDGSISDLLGGDKQIITRTPKIEVAYTDRVLREIEEYEATELYLISLRNS
jgi:hypothetical protein